MAKLEFTVPLSGIGLVASTWKTVGQIIAPANQRVLVWGWRLGLAGTVTTDPPVGVRLVVQTNAGTGGSSVTPVPLEDEMTETIQTTALAGPTSGTWGAEPTTGNLIKYLDTIHPQGRIPEIFLLKPIVIKGGTRLGLQMNNGSGAVNTVTGILYCEE
jgi:hypothetical protein